MGGKSNDHNVNKALNKVVSPAIFLCIFFAVLVYLLTV